MIVLRTVPKKDRRVTWASASAAGHASHRKSNSHTTAGKEQRATLARVSDGPRGRGTDGRGPEKSARAPGQLVGLRWEVDFSRAVLHVRRVKGGTPSVHPVSGVELRALRRLQRESKASPFVFVSERGAPFTTAGFPLDGAGRSCGWPWAQGPSAHAPSFLRLRVGQCRARHPITASIPRAQQHSAYRPLHGASAGPVQELLERLRTKIGR
jgi:hypothetical protein